jgi:hypothetical protein
MSYLAAQDTKRQSVRRTVAVRCAECVTPRITHAMIPACTNQVSTAPTGGTRTKHTCAVCEADAWVRAAVRVCAQPPNQSTWRVTGLQVCPRVLGLESEVGRFLLEVTQKQGQQRSSTTSTSKQAHWRTLCVGALASRGKRRNETNSTLCGLLNFPPSHPHTHKAHTSRTSCT